ncbi:MAG: formyltransferase family protein [Chloroflexi bacterium]|nr:formyltransferase family protein [Chloroflexota bacterium]
MLHIGWFSTARGNSSRILLNSVFDKIQNGALDVRIDFVFCSREPGESENTDLFIKQVNDYKIPLICFSVKNFAQGYQQPVGAKDGNLPGWRVEYDRRVMDKLKAFDCKLCLLAGYMLIVGPEMCARYDMINLHPALPTGPRGTWQEVIWQLIKENADESGVMMHLVTTALDRGPVISFCRYPIKGPAFDPHWAAISNSPLDDVKAQAGQENELFKLIRQQGFERETPLILHTLTAFSSGKIVISGNTLFDEKKRRIPGYDLTAKINLEIKKINAGN